MEYDVEKSIKEFNKLVSDIEKIVKRGNKSIERIEQRQLQHTGTESNTPENVSNGRKKKSRKSVSKKVRGA